jgi:hypothetical protein
MYIMMMMHRQRGAFSFDRATRRGLRELLAGDRTLCTEAPPEVAAGASTVGRGGGDAAVAQEEEVVEEYGGSSEEELVEVVNKWKRKRARNK